MPMKANKIEPQSQTRKQKKDTPWILHIFNHICFVTTIIGCYSCHWKIKQEKKFKHGQCCSLRERLFYPCLVISFCMSVLLVFVWVESSNEYNGFDWVIFIGTGLWFFWSIVLLSFLGILAAYTSLLLVLGFLLLWEGIELYLHWCHKILILLVIVICSFFFWILFTYWKDRWLTVGLSLQLGPENTIMSFEKAVEHGAYGLESDVHISYDHVPFLMHDSDLRRTTNIKEVLPNASLTHPSLFDWDFLSTLNAGKWFSHAPIKPFFGMKPLSEADRERAGNQKIPKLTELLELAQKEKKFVIFDLYGPAPNHSLRALYVHHVVSTILDSQIEQRLIFWLPGFEREYVKKKAPGFQQVSRLRSVERLTKENITRINVDYKNLFYNGMREYRAANISINLYLVNEPWLFSLAWCSRIPSVTTDNIQVLNEMTQPSYFMTPKYYLFVWILMDILSAVFIVAIFYFHWWKESKKEKVLKSTSIHTDIEETASNMEKGSLETLGLLPSSSQPRSKEPSATQAPSVSQQPPGRKLSHHQDPPKRNMLPGVAKNIRSPVSPKGNIKPPMSPKEKINPAVSTKGGIKPPVHPKGVVKPPAPPKMEARPLASPKREIKAPVPLKGKAKPPVFSKGQV
ncbi:glycerophosphodiester phosphodiesterase domain-containing protein 4-like isoform X2 [Bubalus kerabau]|uniref:glycerophosphodiester phosphodiesterase domain-containing protein 4 isoform X2 n=1 Tax=Bubalus bubalis TaxID=89462 RepID=UPI001E1B70DD|nr:glycerophosphodiester phosphodiesterase domain-containing protein 4 isoform X2 [Bubalus bubalis]XP_055437363.1 glycerophosphodiester phosphodiesterase domain-containing protein 4-like isoform X2 [Bubalus carabanensis]